MRLPRGDYWWSGMAIALVAMSAVWGAEPKNAHGPRANHEDQRALALVEEALAAESAGDSDARDAKIKQAMELAPHLPAAHWVAGQVQVRGHWVSLEDAEKRLGHDPVWRQYCDLRESKEPSVETEQSLAIWCREHKLAEQSRVHWRRLLNDDPQNAQALKDLNLRWYRETLLTPAEITELKHHEAQVAKATTRWQPKLVDWRKEIQSEHLATRQKAVDGIQSIDDPAVIPVFETLLTHNSPDNNDPAFSVEMIRSLGKLKSENVAWSLARLAIRARWTEARSEAIKQLSSRELTDYVPYVLSLLRSPIQRTSKIYIGPDGNAYYYWRTCQNNFDAEDVRESLDKIIIRTDGGMTKEVAQESALITLRFKEGWKFKAVADQNALWADEMQNARELFRLVALSDQGNDLQDWWDWWANYNDLAHSSDKPVRAFWHFDSRRVTFGCQTCSCFVAGTKVSTQTGLRPIEEIKPGDAVLAQDPQTGELAYQCVLATTIRPPSALRKLTVAGEEIVTTRGHRFWRDGRGWQMAKFLNEADLLHTVSGALPIAAVGDAGEDQAYNLVVENFHTYFVGEHRILVHDNSAPKPVLGPVPGLSLAEQ